MPSQTATTPCRYSSRFDLDNERIGLNIRRWFFRRKHVAPDLTWKCVAIMAGIHPVSISRTVSGGGVSESTLLRIAQALNIHPGRLLVGIEHWERFPNIPRYQERSERCRRAGYGKPVRSINTLLTNDTFLSTFVGGVYDPETLEWVRRAMHTIKERTKKSREAFLDQSAGRLPANY